MLLVNDVYKYGNRRYRLLWRNQALVYWIDIDNQNALPKLVNLNQLTDALGDNLIEYINDPYEGFILSPIVERQLKTLHAKFKPYAEGYVTGAIGKKRAGRDYRLDAELTLIEITRIIIYWASRKTGLP